MILTMNSIVMSSVTAHVAATDGKLNRCEKVCFKETGFGPGFGWFYNTV